MRKRMGKVLRKAGDALGNVDDKVQGYARKVLGEKDGRFPEGNVSPFQLGKTMLGDIIHGDRRTYTNDWQGKTALGGSRALQAGGLTLAGVGVANLTSQLTGFGGPADQQTSSQIQIDYNTPAHGSTLSPESHYVYKQVHQELMKGTEGVAEQLRADVSAGKYDYDPQLAAHFVDVMG